MRKQDDRWPLISANRHAYDIDFPIPPELAAQIAALERDLADVRASTSWRITEPLRWAMTKLSRRKPLEAGSTVALEPEPPPATYAQWLRHPENLRHRLHESRELGRRRVRVARLGIVLFGDTAPDTLGVSYADCQVLTIENGSGPGIIDTALAQMDVDYICFLDATDRLEPEALTLAADLLAREPALDVVFADEDWLDANGDRELPFLKPGWDEDLQRGTDLLGPFTVLRTSLVRQQDIPAGPAWQYQLASRVAFASQPERIRHIPVILCHRAARPHGQKASHVTVARAELARDGVAAQALPIENMLGWQRVIYEIPQPAPLVSIIVPSRDRADLLRVCAHGILNNTAYDQLELLIVDNGTCEPDALALLDRLAQDDRVRVLKSPGPFNWATLNNHAAAQAAGDVLVLLNNDIAIHRSDWLTELVAQAMRPRVGAVGAKLLYPDGRLQHVGLSTEFSTGIPRHLLHFAPDSSGPFGLLALAREVWGITGACIATRRSVFFEIGGLNEALAVCCNDIEFCVRLRASGYRVLWTPWAELEHREQATRGKDVTAEQQAVAVEEIARLRRDWGNLMRDDPHYPPALDSRTELFRFFYTMGSAK